MKKERLSKEEARLLKFPPTQSTWYCEHTEEYEFELDDGSLETRERSTKVCNAGSRDECWLCGEPKTQFSELAWPTYQEALRKAGEDGA